MLKEQAETGLVKLLSKGIGRRIEITRGAITQNAFAKSIGISKSTLIRYENEARLPDAEILAAICSIYEADLNWLVTGNGNSTVSEDKGKKQEPKCVEVPKYDIAASAGYGSFVDIEGEPEWISIDRQWLRRILNVNPLDISVIYVRGDSMQPTIMDGDMLLVSSVVGPIHDGIYVSRYEGLLQVKRLQRQPRGIIRVISDNPAYDAFSINLRDEVESFTVVGRVVWVGHRF